MLEYLTLTQKYPSLCRFCSVFLVLCLSDWIVFNDLSSSSQIYSSITFILLSPTSEFLIQILHFSDIEITFGSSYTVCISLIQCEYVSLYITENSLTATLKSFSADSIWVISQLDSFECFFSSPSLDWFTFSCFFVIVGHILDIGNVMFWRLRILANFSKKCYFCLFIHASRQLISVDPNCKHLFNISSNLISVLYS